MNRIRKPDEEILFILQILQILLKLLGGIE